MKEISIVIIGCILAFGFSIWGLYAMETVSCQQKYKAYEPQYSFWGGCQVMWSGKLTPTDIIREIE